MDLLDLLPQSAIIWATVSFNIILWLVFSLAVMYTMCSLVHTYLIMSLRSLSAAGWLINSRALFHWLCAICGHQVKACGGLAYIVLL